jgi:hypothetical protein
MQGRGDWGMRGRPMIGREMWWRAAMRGNPQQRCIDRLAWRAAHRAYVETELNLTSEQRPLWDKLQTIAQSEQRHEGQLCNHLKPLGEMTMLDRIDRAQQFLSASRCVAGGKTRGPGALPIAGPRTARDLRSPVPPRLHLKLILIRREKARSCSEINKH